MADFASNVPISRPRRIDWKSAWDIGGMQWSHEWGMFYQSEDEMTPLRKPSPRSGN